MRRSTKRAIEKIMGKYYKEKREEYRKKLNARNKAQMVNEFKEKTCKGCKNRGSEKCSIRRNANMELICDGEEQIEK